MRPKQHADAGATDAREVGNALGTQKAIARLARKQHGIVSRTQLLALGIGAEAIKRRVRAGRLKVVYRGTYLVGPMMPALAREMAAVLACGEAAVLSHRSAATLWKLLPYPAQSAVHLTVPRALAQRAGMRIHRVKALPPDEVMRQHGIPITTPARTVLDLAASVTAAQLEQALATAESDHRTSRRQLALLLARHPRRRGTRRLRRLLERYTRPALTRSQAERRLLDLIRKAGLPAPEVNFMTERYELDLYWPEHRFAVEIDSLWTHGSASSFEADRRRDAELAADGLQVVRITDVGIADEPERQIALISLALALRRAAA
jgi:predicted transcriptional regulator of viral defense system